MAWPETGHNDEILNEESTPLPGRGRATGRKRDLWGRLKTILVGRLKDRYGLSDSQAEIRAEQWLRLSPDQWMKLSSEAFTEKPARAKVVAIR